MYPKVSVIIPTYNVERYIDECIESILNQTYSNFEIVICDDCSTDNTLNYIKKYKDLSNVKVLSNDKNINQAATRNKCIEASSGEYILIQDADDISSPRRIELLLNAFEENVDFVGSACYCFNSKDGKYEKWIKRYKYPLPQHLLSGIPFVHGSMLFRKDCLLDVGGYRQSKHTKRGEDYDLIMRLYAKGYRGKNIGDLLYGYRVDGETLKRRSFKARVDECFVRYEGFKANHIMFPFGWVYVFKPIVAFFYQIIKYRKITGLRFFL